MNFDNDLVVGKLRRWGKFLAAYRLPDWDAIPDFGLYMEQVVQLLKQYLDYLPPERKHQSGHQQLRAQTSPGAAKKHYYPFIFAYLIFLLSSRAYGCRCCRRSCRAILRRRTSKRPTPRLPLRHQRCAKYFIEQVRLTAAAMFDREVTTELNVRDTPEMIVSAAILKRLHEPVCGKAHAAGGQDACRRRKH